MEATDDTDLIPAVLVDQTIRALAFPRYGSVIRRHHVLSTEARNNGGCS